MEEYLDLLGTCHRDLTTLRSVFAELLDGCRADAEPHTPEDESRVRRLLQKLAPVIEAGHCPTCAQPLPESTRRPRRFCTGRCRGRYQTLRRRGLLPGSPNPALPRPRKERLEPGEGWWLCSRVSTAFVQQLGRRPDQTGAVVYENGRRTEGRA